ncbi:patatin-like phospholipase family protein [Azospirillum sp.]|uniref:patatin-like phospholipase family protein n=1 Tax=Azospirillum sp. TaxID=34012 RepID=UPI002D3996DB|nr:patatin-like phospholipase family protein [Azospirillum sp.]HYD69711.1 patatin-like phospholipase family protein [Azospirillum sp.]
MSGSIHGDAGGGRSLTTEEVLHDERREIWGDDAVRPQAALCLSGGGIRSASFALGVIQALACKGLLTRFHYLSTVSGGGYIGGWLTRWIHDEMPAHGNDLMAAASKIEKDLAESAKGEAGSARPLRRLREYTNFLTPQTGIASTDTWTGFVLVARNLLLNWLIFVPALLLVALAPNLVVRGMDAYGYRTAQGNFAADAAMPPGVGILLLGLAALFAAVFLAGRYLPSHAIGAPEKTGVEARNAGLTEAKSRMHAWIAGAGALWALLLVVYLSPAAGFGWVLQDKALPAAMALKAALATVVVSNLAYFAAALVAGREDRRFFLRQLPFWFVASLVPAALIYGGCLLLWLLPAKWQLDVLATAGPLWIMIAHLLQSAAYTGLRGARWGDDDDREWLARLSAVSLAPIAGWALLAAACLLLPRLLWDEAGLFGWISAGVAGVSAPLAAWAGNSAKSAVEALAKRAGDASGGWLNLALVVVTPIAIAGLFAGMSRIDVTIAQQFLPAGVPAEHWTFHLWKPLLVLALVLAAVVAFMSWRINVNRFSLHGLYRNRLARAFLGSANEVRQPHPFTGFDPEDNPDMYELGAGNAATASGGRPRRVLFPVVNVALNLTRSDRLAWQERKAMSFTFTPLASGSAQLHPDGATLSARDRQDPCKTPAGAYVPSSTYGGSVHGNRPGQKHGKAGVSLATAITISGAAASPNMGYHSSPATAFLMTLFNVRLGAWLANPAIGKPFFGRKPETLWQQSGPPVALWPLVSELLGRTDERGRFVYLSDGGHFENLGVYEMLRRRCCRIIVSDAGCDPGCTFEDLGNLVRKAYIDHDATIEFKEMRLASRKAAGPDTLAFAYGTITYPESDEPTGEILYIKPSYFGDMPLDVRAYAEAHADFPHESTGDQWFSESQFESYRRLGYFLTMKAAEAPELKSFFDGLRDGAACLGSSGRKPPLVIQDAATEVKADGA